MNPILKRIPGIFISIANWVLIYRFGTQVLLIDFLILFLLSAGEYFILFFTQKILKLFKVYWSLDEFTGDFILQTTFLYNLFAILNMPLFDGYQFLSSPLIFAIVSSTYHTLAFHYNKLMIQNYHFKIKMINLLYAWVILILFFAIIIRPALDYLYFDLGSRILFILIVPPLSLNGIVYAYRIINRKYITPQSL